jgi:hypothetical protein
MIRSWLERRRERKKAEVLTRRVPKIIGRLGELIEKYPDGYMDETWLPLDKSGMKTVLKIAIAAENDSKKREWLKVGWLLLSQFQPNIGQTPVRFASSSPLPSPEEMEALSRYVQISERARVEEEQNVAELNDFLARLPN